VKQKPKDIGHLSISDVIVESAEFQFDVSLIELMEEDIMISCCKALKFCEGSQNESLHFLDQRMVSLTAKMPI
jgi:hypothetical protein